MPRRVMPCPFSRRSRGSCLDANILCEAQVPLAYRAKIHLPHLNCQEVVGVSFISEDFYDELGLMECNYLIKYLMRVLFVILSDVTANMGDAFCYSPLHAVSVFFFCYVNETSGSRLGKDVPLGHL